MRGWERLRLEAGDGGEKQVGLGEGVKRQEAEEPSVINDLKTQTGI